MVSGECISLESVHRSVLQVVCAPSRGSSELVLHALQIVA